MDCPTMDDPLIDDDNDDVPSMIGTLQVSSTENPPTATTIAQRDTVSDSTPDEDDEELPADFAYASQLQVMVDMGFDQMVSMRKLLEKKGDLNRAVEELLVTSM